MIEITVLIGLVSAFAGLSGWLATRDKTTGKRARTQGEFGAKLDSILAMLTGLRGDVDRLEDRVNDCAQRLTAVEAASGEAHRRLDEIREEQRWKKS